MKLIYPKSLLLIDNNDNKKYKITSKTNVQCSHYFGEIIFYVDGVGMREYSGKKTETKEYEWHV